MLGRCMDNGPPRRCGPPRLVNAVLPQRLRSAIADTIQLYDTQPRREMTTIDVRSTPVRALPTSSRTKINHAVTEEAVTLGCCSIKSDSVIILIVMTEKEVVTVIINEVQLHLVIL